MKTCLGVVLLLLQLVWFGDSFRSNRAYRNQQGSSSLSMKSGQHGQGFKFLPLERGGKKYHFPRIVQIAGVYPDLSPEDLMAPSSTPAPPMGQWVYDFSDPSGPQMGTVALPGSILLTNCADPVIVITTNLHLGVSFPEEVEMLVCIDRGDRDHVSDNFFAFRTPENRVLIQWSDKIEPGYDILGKVAVCVAPFLPSMEKPKTGFEEEDGEDDDEP